MLLQGSATGLLVHPMGWIGWNIFFSAFFIKSLIQKYTNSKPFNNSSPTYLHEGVHPSVHLCPEAEFHHPPYDVAFLPKDGSAAFVDPKVTPWS